MSLLLPFFIAAAGLIALPIVLHFLRRQPRERVPFPTLRFLGPHALRDTRRQELLRWLTLLARCAIILLVALAFSRPYWPHPEDRAGRAVIVAVDNSFSMQTTGRRRAVDNWLAQQLASLHPGDRLGVLQLQPTPVWLAPLSDNLAAGRTALQAREDGYESSHYAPGLTLAGAVLDETPAAQRQILLAGDEQRVAWNDVDFRQAFPPGVELLTAPPAPLPPTQAAISNFHATRGPGNQLELSANVRLFLPEKLHRTVTFSAGNQTLGVVRVDLTAGENHLIQADFPLPAANGDLPLRASIDDDDLPADDTAYAVLPPENSRRVLLAAPAPDDVDFLAAALASVHGGDLPSLTVTPLLSTAWPAGSVAVLRGSAPFSDATAPALDKFLESGGAAWMLCDGSPAQTAWLARHGVKIAPARPANDGEALHLRDFDLDHPLFAPFVGRSLASLLDAGFQVGWSLADNDADTLARWPDRTTAIAEVTVGSGRLLVTGFDDRRATGDWPLQTAFVPFAHHAIVWLGETHPAQLQTGHVGQRLNLPGPGLWQPLFSPRPATPRQISGVVIPDAPGIYAFHAVGPTRLFAVNVDPAESDLSPWPDPGDFARLVSTEPRSSAQTSALPVVSIPVDHNTQIWWWLLAAAALLLGLELGLANRTVA